MPAIFGGLVNGIAEKGKNLAGKRGNISTPKSKNPTSERDGVF
jgi:hypothetical protein